MDFGPFGKRAHKVVEARGNRGPIRVKFNDVKHKRPRELRGPKAEMGPPEDSKDASRKGITLALGDNLVGGRIGHHRDGFTTDHSFLDFSWGRKVPDLIQARMDVFDAIVDFGIGNDSSRVDLRTEGNSAHFDLYRRAVDSKVFQPLTDLRARRHGFNLGNVKLLATKKIKLTVKRDGFTKLLPGRRSDRFVVDEDILSNSRQSLSKNVGPRSP